MARLLMAKLSSLGLPVRSVSWRDQMRTETRPNVGAALRELWVESWRLMFLGHATRIPPTFEQFEGEGWEDKLKNLDLPSNSPAGLLASAWLDFAGQTLIQHEVIGPACNRGTWIIEESFGLKLMLKELLTARALGGDAQLRAEVDSALEGLREMFRHRMPDVGVVVSGPVELAYRWRTAEAGGTGSLEDLGAAGRKGWIGFETLQTECDRFFRDLTASSGWLLFEIEDAPAEENFARLNDRLRTLPACRILEERRASDEGEVQHG